MTCEDCLHYLACKNTYELELDKPYENCGYVADKCEDFSNKAEWVHLPCKVGEIAYYVDFCDKDITPIKIGVIELTQYQYKDMPTIWMDSDGNNFHGELNKDFFLTKEEAEKALAERKEK